MDAAASDLNERRKARGLQLFRGAAALPAARNDATRTLKLSAAGSDFTSRDFEIIGVRVDVQTAVAATFREDGRCPTSEHRSRASPAA